MLIVVSEVSYLILCPVIGDFDPSVSESTTHDQTTQEDQDIPTISVHLLDGDLRY